MNDQKIRALVDTGSESSLVNAETASLNGWIPTGPAPQLASAENTQMRSFGLVNVDLTIEIGDTVKTAQKGKFPVIENLCYELILGMDMLRWLQITIDPASLSLSFKTTCKNVCVARPVAIPPRCQKVVRAQVPNNLRGVIQTNPFNRDDDSLLVANAISEIQEGEVDCLVINLGIKEKFLN